MRSANASNYAPVARRCNRRRACAARPKGKNEKLPEGSLLLSRQLKFFPATVGGRWAAVPPSSFIQAAFTSQRSLLWYFPCTPRATALRQARVSGGNLQNCAPSAACGGAMTQESTVPLRPFPVFPAYAISSISYSRVPMPSFSPCSRPACQLVSGKSAVK